jgi:hypothetical protein
VPHQCRKPGLVSSSPGKIVHYHPPGGLGVRVDSAVYHGYSIPPYYDSLVGKLIVHGKTRGECLMRLSARSTSSSSTASRPRSRCSARWCGEGHHRRRLSHPLARRFLARGGMEG